MIGLRSGGNAARPRPIDGPFAFSIAGGVAAPAEARNGVVDGLASTVDDAVLVTLRLLVSELATNCVQHAHADSGNRIDVAVSLPPGAVRVEVSTAGPPFEAPRAKPALPGRMNGDGGRGLYIVDALARSWGVAPGPANSVWFEIATLTRTRALKLPPPAAPPPPTR
ncbi:MAG: ATP-binding protein [Gaiellaceae bacterium]